MEPLFRVEMLGRFGIKQGNREITRFRTQKTGALLACLALHRSRSHPRDVLIEQFWPDSDLKAARTNLSVALNALRRQLEPPGIPAGAILIADHTRVRLNPAAFTTDVEEFEASVRAAEANTETARRLALSVTAVDLYNGDLLPGYYEDWIIAERDRLRDTYGIVLRNMVRDCLALNQPERGIEYARRLVQLDPFDEEAYRTLIRLLLAVGRSQDALRQYQELEQFLERELQTRPAAATRELLASVGPISPAVSGTREKPASHNREPEAVEVPARLPSPRTAPLRLPVQFTRFFGREEEIARLSAMLDPLSPSPCRLVTLTGPGGTGKTRLSIEAAGRIREAFPGGIWFTPLAELDDPRRLGEALRDALDLPRRTGAALDQVIAFLNGPGESSLLVLDNFEQIAAGGAPVVWTLLSRVSSLRCLVTSRQPLSLAGEQEVPILPLPVPEETQPATPDVLVAYPSVALFVDRAQAVRPEFQVTSRNASEIAAICEKLEGIPLAIELAAARARALTPSQIRERIAARFDLLASRRVDKGERHRSLWAAIDWSYHLLSPDLQSLFARLSVFRGGWTLEAAEAVAGDSATAEAPSAECHNTLDNLTQLRGHSLIRVRENAEGMLRFDMLETLREFAQEQLSPEQRMDRERAHAAYFRQWAGGAHLFGNERTVWFARFDADMDNLRAVLAWSLQEKDRVAAGLQTAGSLGSFWWLRGHFSEGRRWFDRLLEDVKDNAIPGLSRSLHVAGILAYLQGDFPASSALLERCIEVCQLPGNESVRGVAHEALGNVAYRQGNYEAARIQYEQALSLAREHGMPRNVASVLGNLANVAQSTGDFEKCRALNLESLEILRANEERNGEARTLHNLANLAQSQGQYEEARVFYEQSMLLHRDLADRLGVGGALRGMAEIAFGQNDTATALTLALESLAVLRGMDARPHLVEVLRLLTDLAWASGKWEAAARTQGTLESVREEMNYPVPPVDREEYDRNQEFVRQTLGTAVYDAVRAEGKTLTLEQGIAYLEELLQDSPVRAGAVAS